MTGVSRRSALFGAGAFVLCGPPSSASDTQSQPLRCGLVDAKTALLHGLEGLRKAYPSFVRSVDVSGIQLSDNSAMPVTLFPEQRPMAEKIRVPDLAAQVTQRYPQGRCAFPASPDMDAGRVRYIPFFQKMYGGTPEAVTRNLKRVRWPTKERGGYLEVSRVNGIADKLASVADHLAGLPDGFRKFFDNPGGGHRWREVAGSERLSGHALGFAVDINLSHGDYWRRFVEAGDEEAEDALWPDMPRPPNRIPFEIVEVFEKHGFIWGGKWYHFDTPHFEYRPELLFP